MVLEVNIPVWDSRALQLPAGRRLKPEVAEAAVCFFFFFFFDCVTESKHSLSSINRVYFNPNKTMLPQHAELIYVHKPGAGGKPELKDT